MLIAANMRPAITSVGPLIEQIRAATGISAAVGGLLTALPVLAFAVVSPLAARMARRVGIERTLQAAVAILAVGVLVRSAGPVAALFAGTVLLGAAIAVGNVLLPALVRQDFPRRTGLVTGLYTSTMVGVAGLGAGLAVPLAELGLGWRGSLAAWGLPAAIGLAVWSVHARHARHLPRDQPTRPAVRLRRSPVAWQVALHMGLQSLMFYSLITWMPSMLEDDGMQLATTGWMLAVLQIAGLPATMLVPVFAARTGDQRRLVAAIGVVAVLSVGGMWTLGADAALLWVIPLGFSLGANLSLTLTLFVLRTRDPGGAAQLSGMAQSVGYGIAAIGPIGIGYLHDVTGSWDAAAAVLLVTALATFCVGLGAARDRYVDPAPPPAAP